MPVQKRFVGFPKRIRPFEGVVGEELIPHSIAWYFYSLLSR